MHANYNPSTYRQPSAFAGGAAKQQGGYALVVVVILMLIGGVIAAGGLDTSEKSEKLAANAIQKSRSFHAADGASYHAQARIQEFLERRVFADDAGQSGLYTRDSRPAEWWRANEGRAANESLGIHTVEDDAALGVVQPPTYSIEMVGNYLSDGGTGVVNLDIGGSAYGRTTSGGREIILFDVESHGFGSFDKVQKVVETAVAFTY